MNDKLAEKRRKLDEARARQGADNSDLGTVNKEDLPADAIVTQHGDVVLHGKEVDPNETNAMGERAINSPEGNVSDINRDTDTDGDADGDPMTWGHQGIDTGPMPPTSDPRVNPVGAGLNEDGTPIRPDTTLPAGTPAPSLAPAQTQNAVPGSTNVAGTTTADGRNLEGVSPRISARTQAELDRGKEAIGRKDKERTANQQRSRTVITDADEDEGGEKGRKAAEKKASDTKKTTKK